MPDFSSWVDFATVVGGFATALAAAFAIVGLPIAYIQIKSNRSIQREATAKSLYRQYLEDAINRPDLVVPDLAKIRSEGRLTQYELFVAHMLYSLEEVLDCTRGDKEWRAVVKGQLRRHSDYFASDEFQNKKSYYTRSLVALIDEGASPLSPQV